MHAKDLNIFAHRVRVTPRLGEGGVIFTISPISDELSPHVAKFKALLKNKWGILATDLPDGSFEITQNDLINGGEFTASPHGTEQRTILE
jgi:hypothetical protein